MTIELDPEAETLVQRAMEVEGWSSPAMVVRELLARYEPPVGEEPVAGYTKAEILRLVAEAESEPGVRTTPEEFGRWMDGVIEEAVANR